MASHLLDHLPVGMDVGSHKLTGKLLIFVACQYVKGDSREDSKEKDEIQNYIIVLEVDQNNNYSIQEQERIKTAHAQITRIMYKKNYGLILACYRGYIEHFDGNSFKSVHSWANDLKQIGSSKTKEKLTTAENKK